MFWTYLRRELRRRRRQTFVVALGLGVGIGLVVTVSSLSSSVGKAQTRVLHSLYGVGTDLTVTQEARPGSGGSARFGFGPPTQAQSGRQFTRDHALPSPGRQSFAASRVATIAGVDGVGRAVGALELDMIHLSGTFSSSGGGSGTFPPFSTGNGSTPRPPVHVSTYTLDGVDVSALSVGPLGSASLESGRSFRPDETNAAVAVVDHSYAKQHSLKVGSKLTIGGTAFHVIGVEADSSSSADIYVPLARAQSIGDAPGQVNIVYVKAANASNVSQAQAGIEAALPKATVTSSSDLASQVTGSLSSASSLANDLGKWLSVAVLIAAFVLASLLTVSAVSRRVREFGTLKALGWRTRRVVRQVMGEAMAQGLLGGLLGIVLGVAGAIAVVAFMPTLSATVGGFGGFGGGGFNGGGGFDRSGFAGRTGGPSGFTRTVPVHLTASVSAEIVVLAIVLAVAGGLIAGSIGGWRAARLQPAEALRRVD